MEPRWGGAEKFCELCGADLSSTRPYIFPQNYVSSEYSLPDVVLRFIMWCLLCGPIAGICFVWHSYTMHRSRDAYNAKQYDEAYRIYKSIDGILLVGVIGTVLLILFVLLKVDLSTYFYRLYY